MMDHVVHHHAAHTRNPRHRKNSLAPREQCPVLHQLLIARARQSRTGFLRVLVELGKKVLLVIDLWKLKPWTIDRRDIQLLGLDGHCRP